MSTNNSLSEQFKKLLGHQGKFGMLKIFGFSIIGVVSLAAGIFGYFLYQNIFSTYANLGTIASFNTIARIEVIDKQSFTDTNKIKKLKETTVVIPENLRNIFIYKEVPTSTKKIQ